MSLLRFTTFFALVSLLSGCVGTLPWDQAASPSGQANPAAAGPASTQAAPAEMVAITVGGSGTVTSSPVGIDCLATAGTCSQSFASGTAVTLSAAPAAGNAFVGWSGACSGTALTCDITVSTAETVSANFAPSIPMEALQVTVGGAGSVSSTPTGINCVGAGSCSQSFASGTAVTLVAAASSGNTFVGWTGACSGSASSCTVTMSAAQSVGATFSPIVQNDSLLVTVGGTGTVTSRPAGINCSGASGCSQSFANGTQITLTAAPATGNTFSGWSGGCSGSSATCSVTITTSTLQVGANFAATARLDTLLVSVSGTGTVGSSPSGISCSGSTGCSQTFTDGTSVTLAAVAGSGYTFSGWSGACSGTASSCTLTLAAPSVNVAASFVAVVQNYGLQVTDGGNGTVTSSPAGINCTGSSGCSQSYAAGTSVQLTATPSSGYTFSGWTGACSGTATTCTITMNAAQNVGATFAATTTTPAVSYLESNPYPLTGDQPSYFLVSCDGATAVNSPPAVNSSGALYLYYSLGGLSSGSHTCTVVAVDASGMQSSAVSDTFTL